MASAAVLAAPPPAVGTVLPRPEFQFVGKLGRTVEDSAPQQYPPTRIAPANAPNIVVVLTDDTGFGAPSAFGGPVPTPALQKLADRGLRYNNFHVTALCSPTRASLLTGRNAHAVGFGLTIEGALGYPGYNMLMPKRAATFAEILRQNGYSTAMFGKHHNTPRWEATAAGPFDTWPTGLGFEYFYGFNGGDDDQYRPTLYRGTNRVPTPTYPGYILDRDLADDAINWIHAQKGSAPDKPFLIYYSPGTNHAPHQAPREWIDRFRGRFDQGWDKLREATVARQKADGIVPKDAVVTPRPKDIPAWDSLTADQRRLYARMMEVYAAMHAHQDYQIGRVFDEIERMGELDNTLVVYISGDNGASAEGGLEGTTNEMGRLGNSVPETEKYMLASIDELGGPNHYNNYPAGWTWAMNAPFPFFKQVASHLGGTTDGMVISWPKKIAARGNLRTQFGHVVDIAPTLLEAVGVPMPTSVNGVRQMPVDGTSLAYTFTPQGETAPSRHTLQVYEMRGHKGIYQDGWMASTTPKTLPWTTVRRDGLTSGDHKWELYDLRRDFAQGTDVSAAYPDRLERMKALWWKEAERNKILPVTEGAGAARFNASIEAHGINRPYSVYWGPLGIPEGAAPSLRSRSFTITADLHVAATDKGVILATGNGVGGWSFYLDKGELVAYCAFSRQKDYRYRVAAPFGASGPVKVQFDFDYDGGGAGKGGLMRISVDGVQKASGRVDRVGVVPQNSEEFNIGYDSGAPVSDDYSDENRFTGTIRRVEVKLR